ncbi:MAG: hypothetical protein EBT32_05425 [Betaproteobacteria bacterium]|nr:hypothetical protein [Betaproteobacteria bacterium]
MLARSCSADASRSNNGSGLQGAGTDLRRAEAFVQPGLVIGFGADGPLIACGADCLELREVQAAGGLRQPASRWASQVQLRLGDRLGDPGIADRVGA